MTALQELIKDFTEMSKKEGDSGFVGRSVLAIIKNKGYLDKERTQIINAYDLGSLSDMQYPDPKTVIENGEQYFNVNFESEQS
jgi:hypothetical protein